MVKIIKRKSGHFVLFILTQAVFVFNSFSQGTVTPDNALQSYLHNGDKTFSWEVKETYESGDVKVYVTLLVSQQWREFKWVHQLTIFVPKEVNYDGALLFITGGSIKDGMPNWAGPDDKLFKAMAPLAAKNKAIVAVVRQTPNQPLFNDLTEDALISYTLHNFKNDHDYTWPLLFPMVKTAVRSMDAVQEFSKKMLNRTINRFVVSGASKRGWTTWLTGANDNRVTAIGPMVIDVLNMPVNLDYQIKAWNEYSIEIEDYVKLGIPQGARTGDGVAINKMVDPYSYRSNLTMPKMIFMGTNDEYWVVDAIKNYYDSIPGTNMINYTPNAGHDLAGGAHAFESLSAFFGLTLNNKPYAKCTWSVKEKKTSASFKVNTTSNILVDAILWSATSESMKFTKATWTSRSLGKKGKSVIKFTEEYPASGFKAFYLDLKYKDPNGGEYTESTRMFVESKDGLKLH
ncbi:MAG: PhoPQ-activated protein PqaA family protein [Chitinophagaceae bacterium]